MVPNARLNADAWTWVSNVTNEADNVLAPVVELRRARRAAGLFAAAAAFVLASGVALAQGYYAPEIYDEPLSPREVVLAVCAEGFAQISRPRLTRGFYVVEGTDVNGWRMRLLVDAYSGAIVDARPLRSTITAEEPFRPYTPDRFGGAVDVEIRTGRGAKIYAPVPLRQPLPRVAALPPPRPKDLEPGLVAPVPPARGETAEPGRTGDAAPSGKADEGPSVVLAPPEVPPVPPASDVIGNDGDEIGGPASGEEILPSAPF